MKVNRKLDILDLLQGPVEDVIKALKELAKAHPGSFVDIGTSGYDAPEAVLAW